MVNRSKTTVAHGSVDFEHILKSCEPLAAANNNGPVLSIKSIDSPLGPLVAIANDDHLIMLKFHDSSKIERDLKHVIALQHARAIRVDDGNTKPLKSIEFELNEYFAGKLTVFKTPVQISAAETEYQRSILREIASIGYGATSTYSQLAANVGKPTSYRAAANACGRNAICIVVPCHRVLSSGGLGGFGCGIERKVWLLDLEKRVAEAT